MLSVMRPGDDGSGERVRGADAALCSLFAAGMARFCYSGRPAEKQNVVFRFRPFRFLLTFPKRHLRLLGLLTDPSASQSRAARPEAGAGAGDGGADRRLGAFFASLNPWEGGGGSAAQREAGVRLQRIGRPLQDPPAIVAMG